MRKQQKMRGMIYLLFKSWTFGGDFIAAKRVAEKRIAEKRIVYMRFTNDRIDDRMLNFYYI